MTVKELSQLYHLNREIERDQERLERLVLRAEGLSAMNSSGMPRGSSGNVQEKYMAEIIDLRAIIEAKQDLCIHERNRLMRWICEIPDSVLREIFTLRFVDGLSWYQVAIEIGGNTESSVKMACYRYLKTTKK